MKPTLFLIFLAFSVKAQVTIGPAVFSGSGLNDADSGGKWSITSTPANNQYVVTISAAGTPDHFTWKRNGGPASSATAITGSAQSLADGVTILFSATTGHTLNDNWTILTTASGSISSSNFVSVVDFGAKCDGSTVDTAAFLATAAAGKQGLVPAFGVCIVDSAELPSYTSFVGANNITSVIKAGSSGTIFTVTGTAAAHKSNISITNLNLRSSAVNPAAGALMTNFTDDLVFSNNNLTEIQGVVANQNYTYALVTNAWITHNLTAIGNNAYSRQNSVGSVIGSRYVECSTISNNHTDGYLAPIMWWGGDANTSTGDGAPGNTRWATNISIAGNTIKNSGTGVFGSMGNHIAVIGNAVANVADVGLDAEGSDNVTFSGNTVDGALNGGLALYFVNTNVIFISNTVTQPVYTQSLLLTSGLLNTHASTNNKFIGNNFTNYDNSGMATVNTRFSPQYGMSFENNTLRNVAVDFSNPYNSGLQVLNNHIWLTHATSNAIINVNSGDDVSGDPAAASSVSGNDIHSAVSQPGAIPFILSYVKVAGTTSFSFAGNIVDANFAKSVIFVICRTSTSNVPIMTATGNYFGSGYPPALTQIDSSCVSTPAPGNSILSFLGNSSAAGLMDNVPGGSYSGIFTRIFASYGGALSIYGIDGYFGSNLYRNFVANGVVCAACWIRSRDTVHNGGTAMWGQFFRVTHFGSNP